MVTEMISLKLDDNFLAEVDALSKKAGYHSRTEFIREALREKMDEIRRKEALVLLKNMRGSSRTKTSDKELHRIREQVFNELEKKFKENPRALL